MKADRVASDCMARAVLCYALCLCLLTCQRRAARWQPSSCGFNVLPAMCVLPAEYVLPTRAAAVGEPPLYTASSTPLLLLQTPARAAAVDQ